MSARKARPKGGEGKAETARQTASQAARREKQPEKNAADAAVRVPPTLRRLAVPVEQLRPYPANPRSGDTAAIRESLQAHGQYRPIVVRKETGEILAGNHTYAAALELGWQKMAVTYVDVDDDEAARIVLVDNRTNDLAGYDDGQLAALLDSLPSVDGTGFDDRALAQLVAGLERPAAPAPIDPPAQPATRRGEVIELGPHRLLCGDATSQEDVTRLLDGERPALTVTDPPYGVNYDPAWRQEAAEAGKLAYAGRRVGRVANDDRAEWTEALRHCPGDVFYGWHAGRHASRSQAATEAAGFEVRSQIIWSKPHFPISRGNYHWRHEPCWYAIRKGGQAHWIGDRRQTTVWEVSLDDNVDGGHSTQKPVELMARSIRNHQGDVYDPFAGSGSTLVAAHQLDRRCFAMEIDPAYCDVIVARWEAMTGEKAR